jgi:hypothetical protein
MGIDRLRRMTYEPVECNKTKYEIMIVDDNQVIFHILKIMPGCNNKSD